MAEHVLVALSNIIQPVTFLLITGGVALGVLVAALPGLTAPMAIALLIPLTFGLEPYQAISMMAAIYLGGQYGGSITAILIEVQGTAAAAATVFDGYPLSQKGQAGKALGVAVTSSALGGLFGVIILIAFAPALAKAALLFGPAEYFALAIFGLSIVTTISAENLVKGFIAVLIGLFLATVGLDTIAGYPRFTFGIPALRDGLHFIPVMIGLFGVGEVFRSMAQRMGALPPIKSVALQLPSLSEIKVLGKTILRSSGIGAFIGALPGAGGTIAAFVSYNEAKRWSKEPEKFGTGVFEGGLLHLRQQTTQVVAGL